jgi:hypothetical protein
MERGKTTPSPRPCKLKSNEAMCCGVSSKLIWKEGFLEHKSIYQKRKMTSTPHVGVEELKIQVRREVLGDLRPILEAQ